MYDAFKQGLLNGKYPVKQTKNNDILQILVEYKKQEKNGEIEIKEISIETVYRFNDIEITSIPSSLPRGTKFKKPEETPMDRIWTTE
ncbi:MAG: hypothetical protein COB14_00910 [Alphaproteobacteria bacterium]|nr:MAG: hypothetical protein COB14_00910 [Alphaproteobacteria bacterium]